ncbi:hypothetical protein F5884DRAFT_149161 [Xylogone sp. PMI_703]|nr:hypothetical protein F5884DRAFT_149161 [Xylogone sp. PMI_703]
MLSVSFLGMAMFAVRLASCMSSVPLVCLSSPVVPLEAGSAVVATIDNPQGHRCDAHLRFTDPDFLSVHFGFDFLKCAGSQTAQFNVPLDAPNGDAYIIWRCAGEGSRQCNHVSISNGRANPDTITYDQKGTIGCLVPTATFTTLSTVIASSSTLTELQLITAFSTSFSAVPPTASGVTVTPSTVIAGSDSSRITTAATTAGTTTGTITRTGLPAMTVTGPTTGSSPTITMTDTATTGSSAMTGAGATTTSSLMMTTMKTITVGSSAMAGATTTSSSMVPVDCTPSST